MKEGTFRLFDFSKFNLKHFHFSTFRNSIWSLPTFQRFDFSTFWNWKWDPSTFWLFDFSKLTMKPFHFSIFRLRFFNVPSDWNHAAYFSNPEETPICAMIKRRYERLQLRSAITTQNMWFTVCSDRGPCVAIPLFRLCLWLSLPVGRMTFQSFDVRVRHWSSRSGLVFLGSWKMACRQVYMR